MPRREWLAVPLVLGVLVTVAVWTSSRLPDGPVEPHWDHTRCARCAMLLSERGFAAQVQRTDGTVLHYDDPGCLFMHAEEERGSLADAHAVWFHDGSAPRWLSLAEVGFVPAAHSPMDFGLVAVPRAEREDALDPAQARAALLARDGRAP